MPNTNEQELEGWISNRNCESRNAVEFGDLSFGGQDWTSGWARGVIFKDCQCFTPPEILAFFGPTPLFQLFEALFLA